MSVVAIIPARLASSRFPRKVLARSTGKYLIEHVWEQTRKASSIERVVIACDHPEVMLAAAGFGAQAVLTDESHPNGSSRLAQAARLLGLSDEDLVVNVQGDEPEIDPGIIDAAVALSTRTGAPVSTIAAPLDSNQSHTDPNIVKVVLRADGHALYFSRAPIPFARQGGDQSAPVLKHIGLYVYRVGFLHQYVTWAPTPLERTEMLEQLRVLEHGHAIAVGVCSCEMQGIDTPEQYASFVARYQAAAKH